MHVGDVAVWSVRSRDLIAIINFQLSEGVRDTFWFVSKSFHNELNSGVDLRSYLEH